MKMFSQRSLVGMTMGARKRKIEQKHHAHLSWLGAELRAMEWKAYRIGERLRPCPNPFCSKEDGCALRQCHGSGVLPARGQR